MSVKEYTFNFNQLSHYALKLASNMRGRMRKFVSSLTDDLVLDCKGEILNRDMDVSRLFVHMQYIEEQKKRVAEAREKDRQTKRVPRPHVDWRFQNLQPNNGPRYRRDRPTIRGNIGGVESRENSSAPPPPPKGTTSATDGSHNRLYALSNRQDVEASPDIVTEGIFVYDDHWVVGRNEEEARDLAGRNPEGDY
ncbi:uncharacterized protein LOC124899450 [Capsicum annuum]|uniref:uncharacterized protein LOC124899450 n=1 Tax=Capsicum annuum TaxID=4072 RepID=UPI001FB138EF|nr:uncharacterized protein LOC124899450 [Capsicum annuum]